MSIQHNFDLPITTEKTLAEYIYYSFGVQVPNVKCCEKHSTPWQAFCAAYFADSPVVVWKASRGFGGKSFLLALLGLVEGTTLKADVNILGGSGNQSRKVLSYTGAFLRSDSAPLGILDAEIKTETRLANGANIVALPASQKSVRGPHVPRLRLDEVDEMELAIMDAALGQTMSKPNIKAQTVLSSTHQYADGTMTEVLSRAIIKGWPIFEWCYRESMAKGLGWLPKEEIDRKRNEVTQDMWDIEYELQEANPQSRAIVPEKVEQMFNKDLGVYEGRLDEYIEAEPPRPGATYITGGDWAKERNDTVVVTVRTDVHPNRVVAYLRTGRRPWPEMVQKFDERLDRYPGGGGHDITGVGNVINDYLVHDAVENEMSGKKRTERLTSYVTAIENGDYVSPMIRTMYLQHSRASRDDFYGKGHLPDSVSAMATAHFAISFVGEISTQPKGLADYRG